MKTPASSALPTSLAGQVQAVRGFSRFYTQRIGVLDRYLGGELSLTEMRVLYELANHPHPTATELARELVLDAGYLSRLLRRFEARGWLGREPVPGDGRQSVLRLTAAGRAAYEPLAQRTSDETAALLSTVPPAVRPKLLGAMSTVQSLLTPAHLPKAAPRIVLREPRPGDMGWVVEQHGLLYAREYGFNSAFEALALEVSARFLRKFDPEWERGWIAEVGGERAGSVFVVRKSPTVAQLRMLILTPAARGLGLGGRLVDECIAFARARGYRKMMLWTQEQLTAARAIYARRGFELKQSEPFTDYGHDLVSEIWELRL